LGEATEGAAGFAHVLEHLGGEARERLAEGDEDIFEFGTPVAADGHELGHEDGGVHGVKGEEVVLGMNGLDLPGFEGGGREVTEVEGDDEGDAASDGDSEDVAVLGVVGEEGQEGLVTSDRGVGESLGNFAAPGVDEVVRPGRFEFVQLSVADFVEDLVGPPGDEKAGGLGEAEKEVADAEIGEDTGIEDDGKIGGHSSPV